MENTINPNQKYDKQEFVFLNMSLKMQRKISLDYIET